jgi:hypothetical protein
MKVITLATARRDMSRAGDSGVISDCILQREKRMSFVDLFNQVGIVGKLGMVLAVATVAMAAACAWRPNERRLALMRPLSLATIFSALCSFAAGLAVVAHGISASGNITAVGWSAVATGVAEAFMSLVASFLCLTVAWLLVALAMRKGALEVG